MREKFYLNFYQKRKSDWFWDRQKIKLKKKLWNIGAWYFPENEFSAKINFFPWRSRTNGNPQKSGKKIKFHFDNSQWEIDRIFFIFFFLLKLIRFDCVVSVSLTCYSLSTIDVRRSGWWFLGRRLNAQTNVNRRDVHTLRIFGESIFILTFSCGTIYCRLENTLLIIRSMEDKIYENSALSEPFASDKFKFKCHPSHRHNFIKSEKFLRIRDGCLLFGLTFNVKIEIYLWNWIRWKMGTPTYLFLRFQLH